jgi:hypothetical protein
MAYKSDVVAGAIKLLGIPERACYNTFKEFIEALPKMLGVEIPSSVSGVIVGSETPGEDDRNKIWFRRDTGGNFLGIYAFQGGAWHPLIEFRPTSVYWEIGDSANVPAGYSLIDANSSGIPSDVRNAIMAHYVPNNSGGYSYYAMQYVGFGE